MDWYIIVIDKNEIFCKLFNKCIIIVFIFGYCWFYYIIIVYVDKLNIVGKEI